MISSTYDACKKKGWYNENQKKKKKSNIIFQNHEIPGNPRNIDKNQITK